jgi:hypothetical protein
MKKFITITIFALMFFIANNVSAQRVIEPTVEIEPYTNINQDQPRDGGVIYNGVDSGAQADYEREDSESEEDKTSLQNQSAQETENIVSRKTSLTSSGVASRIKQQAKGVREKLLTTITRKNTLQDLRNTKLQNSTEAARQEEERKIRLEEQKADLRKQQGKSEIPTIGESYRSIFNKLNEIQEKIETSLPRIESSNKINIDKVREDLQNSRESLTEANSIIQRLETIELNTDIDEESKSSMIKAKKELIDSKKFLNSILVSLKQASKAKPIIQTGGGSQGGQTGGGSDVGGGANDNDSGTSDKK